MHDALAQQLERALVQLELALSTVQQKKLIAYIELINRWNRAYNLTAVRDPMEMITRHLLDSLAISPLISAGIILDVGTGSGCIAISLAKQLPRADVYAMDISLGALSIAKKNAEANGVVIQFIEASVLDWESQDLFFDVIVSALKV